MKILDDKAYLAMLRYLDQQLLTEKSACEIDLQFLKEDVWLKDAAVIDSITANNGGWDVYLTFAHQDNPMLLRVRKIVSCFSRQKAETAAFYMRRLAAKDKRGTLILDVKNLNLNYN